MASRSLNFESVYLSFIVIFHSTIVNGKIFEKCEVAWQIEESDVPETLGRQWVCSAEALSQLNSSAMNSDPFSTERNQSSACPPYMLGLLQISNEWCSADGHEGIGKCSRNGCNMECSKLLDDDITDDIECLKIINKIQQLRMWPSRIVHECELRNEGWNYTECLIKGKNKEGRQGLTKIPLWAALLIVAFACVLVFALTYFFYRYRQASVNILSPSEIKEFQYGRVKPLLRSPSSIRMSLLIQDNFASEPYNNEYEVPASQFAIDFDKLLGSGAYGVVYKALCRGKVVAAKSIKPFASKEYLQSLLGEIKILSHIGRHDFIVNMEGAHTKDLKKGSVFVFMEYCELGSLEKFLRSKRAHFITKLDDDLKLEDLEENSPISQGETNKVSITLKHLMQYAYQIAKGMDFLSNKQVIHSDLAARNVLLVDENTAKISDFGLSRKLYGYISYIKKKEEPLPWRWMAIESLKEMNFSSASDVWMYGCLLWEIFSLGEVPYPGLSWSLEFVDNLEKGFRMLRPKHASVNEYKEVMLKCWDNNPANRPSFLDLSNYFYQALNKISSIDYTEVVQLEKYDSKDQVQEEVKQ